MPEPWTTATKAKISIASSADAPPISSRAKPHRRTSPPLTSTEPTFTLKYPLAFANYASAITLDPRIPLAPYNRGNAYLDTGQYEQAIADYTRAIELDANFALAYLNRGIAYEHRGDTSAAARDYRQALSIDPTTDAAQGRLRRLQSK